jgi:hypothetical protein
VCAGAASADYCLVPGVGDDLDFFCLEKELTTVCDFFHTSVMCAGAAPADYCLVPGAGDDLDNFRYGRMNL